MTALLRRGIAAGQRHPEISETKGERAAIETALADLQAGDLLVIGVESIEEALAFVQAPALQGHNASAKSQAFTPDERPVRD